MSKQRRKKERMERAKKQQRCSQMIVNSSSSRHLGGPHIHSHFISLTHTQYSALLLLHPDLLVQTIPGTQASETETEIKKNGLRGKGFSIYIQK